MSDIAARVGVSEPVVFPARFGSASALLAHVLGHAATGHAPGVQVQTTAGPAWMTLHGGYGPMRLIDLDDVLPDPWRQAREHDEQERRAQARRELGLRGWQPGTWEPDGDPAGPLGDDPDTR